MQLFPVVFLLCFVVPRPAPLAAKLNCAEAHFWNGTSCRRCSGCPIGQGVLSNCSKSSDTICQDCWPGYDYSDSTGMEACKGCDQDSNCLPGNSKEIQKCTVTSPRVCDGCQEGFYLNLFGGEEGGCMECSPPCSEHEIETQSCKTEHDRVCSKRPSTTEKTSTKRPSTTEKTSTKRPTTFSKDTNDTRKVSTSPFPTRDTGKEDDKGSEPEKTKKTEKTDLPLYEKPWLWAIVAFPVIIIALPIVIVTAVRYRQGNNERAHVAVEEGDQLIQRPGGQPPPRGLDQPLKSIKMEGRRFIANFLNGKDSFGHFYFLRVADEVGLSGKCRGFDSLQNPTDAFLTLYSEKEGSTVRALVDALRKCELTHFASEIEMKFAADVDESIV